MIDSLVSSIFGVYGYSYDSLPDMVFAVCLFMFLLEWFSVLVASLGSFTRR